jgi:hypothetical protein
VLTTRPAPAALPPEPAAPSGLAGPPSLEVTADLPPEWDRLAGSGPVWATRRWLELAPARLPGRPLTFTLRRGGEPVLAVRGTVVTEASANSRLDPYTIFSGGSAELGLAVAGPHPWRGVPAADVLPCLLLMLPHYQTVAVGPAAADPAGCAELVAAVLGWAAGQRIRAVAAQYLDPAAGPLRDALVAAGGTAVTFADRCDLAVTWPDFAGYLAALPSKRRVVVRRERRALAERGVTVTRGPLTDAVDDLVTLRCALVGKYGGAPDRAKETAALDRIRATFGAAATVFAARAGGPLLGFAVFAQDGPQWTPLFCGADYQRPEARLTYFATLFYEPVALAPGLGVRTIGYGLGSWEAKRLRGCARVPLTGVCLRLPGAAVSERGALDGRLARGTRAGLSGGAECERGATSAGTPEGRGRTCRKERAQ